MNWDQIEGKWDQIKGSAKQRWAKLTDDDLTYIHGKRDELIGKVQERYGIAKEEAQKQADEWLRMSASPGSASTGSTQTHSTPSKGPASSHKEEERMHGTSRR